MTNGELASYTGMASGNASQSSILTSWSGLEGVRGGCDSGGPGGGGNAMERADGNML
jgi:hypothetical protein